MHVWVENRNRWNKSNCCQVLCSQDSLSEHRHSPHVSHFLLVAPTALWAEDQGNIKWSPTQIKSSRMTSWSCMLNEREEGDCLMKFSPLAGCYWTVELSTSKKQKPSGSKLIKLGWTNTSRSDFIRNGNRNAGAGSVHTPAFRPCHSPPAGQALPLYSRSWCQDVPWVCFIFTLEGVGIGKGKVSQWSQKHILLVSVLGLNCSQLQFYKGVTLLRLLAMP